MLSKTNIFCLTLFVVLVLITRLYNLDHTARFTRDESSDLARMEQYFSERKISLVGPISSEGDKVFSSLTYYMVMPFAAAVNFTPMGPVYGTAFWGIITAFLLLILANKINPKQTFLAAVLIILWYPLVEMSRWAWNPHFVMLWASLGLLSFFYRSQLKGWGLLLTGIFLGLLFHHHYLAFLATTPFVLIIAFLEYKSKNLTQALLLLLGYSLPFLPFLLFDLRHPPGLFITRYLLGGNTPHVESDLSLADIFPNLYRNAVVFIQTIVIQKPLQYLVGAAVILLAALDIKHRSYKHLVWLTPVITLLTGGIFFTDFEDRYVYPALGFLLVWLVFSRKEKIAQLIASTVLALLVLGSLLSIWGQLTVTKIHPDLYSFTKAADYIEQTIKTNQLNNANVAALSSPDRGPLAETYRDVVRMNGAGLRAPSEYDVSEHLFVVSTSDYDTVRDDQSFSMQAFKEAKLRELYEIPSSPWKVYWLSY